MQRITGTSARNLERAISRGDYPDLCPELDQNLARAWFGDSTHFAAVEYPGLYPVHLRSAKVALRSCWVAPSLRGQRLREDLLTARLTWAGQWGLDRGWSSRESLPAAAWSAGQLRRVLERPLRE